MKNIFRLTNGFLVCITNELYGYYIGNESNQNCLIPNQLIKEEVTDLITILNYKLNIKLQKYSMYLDLQMVTLDNIYGKI